MLYLLIKNLMKKSLQRALMLFLCIMIMPCAAAVDGAIELKAKKDDITKKYGYENVGDKSYWWAEAHLLGASKEQVNQGYETQWVITPQYDHAAKEFSEGLAAVEVGGKVGFIDRYNRFIIPPQFEPMPDLAGFRFGMAAVKKDGKYGFIDKRGLFVIPPGFDDAENFGSDYLAVVKVGNKFGCIDLLGDTVVACEHIAKETMKNVPIKNKAYREEKKRAKNRWENGYYEDFLFIINDSRAYVDSIIRNPGIKTAVNRELDIPSAESLGDGLYRVTAENGKVGVIDVFGRQILPADYNSISYDTQFMLFTVDTPNLTFADKKPQVGLATVAGGWVIPPMLESIGKFNNEGKAPVSIGDYSGEIDINGIASESFLQSLLNASVEEKGTYYTRRLIGVLPSCAYAHNNLGIYYASECDDLKNAIHHFVVAHRIMPDNEDFKANMKAAKSERNSRRWNKVLTGMTIAAAVLSAGAVTYSAIKGNSMTGSDFSSSSMAASTVGSESYSSDSDFGGSSSSGRHSSAGKDTKPVNGAAIRALQQSYDRYESMVVECNTYPEKHQPSDKREYQAKMRQIRRTLKEKHGVERTQSPHETN